MRQMASSMKAKKAWDLVQNLQKHFVAQLDAVSLSTGQNSPCESVEWLRDGGIHGGGIRYETRDESIFDRGSVNISQVHYDNEPHRKLGSATAISTIIHPSNPNVPSMHMHISWTQMKDGDGYWRIMADLNPSIPNDRDTKMFDAMLKEVSKEQYEKGMLQGERYFYIPVLGRYRGVGHFYLEGYSSEYFKEDIAYARSIGEAVIDTYTKIITEDLRQNPAYTDEEKAKQLAYHTLYFFQVLTLDRGTTSGLLVHDQNDVGIMGSIPSHVDRDLLSSWIEKMPKPQDQLLDSLIEVLSDQYPSPIGESEKKGLAACVREHYRKHPEAIGMQAGGEIIPPTVANHR